MGTSSGVVNMLYVMLPAFAPAPSTILIIFVITRNYSLQEKQLTKPCQLGVRTRNYQDNQLQFSSYTKSCFPSSTTTTRKEWEEIRRKMAEAGSQHLKRAYSKDPSSSSTKIQNASLSFLILLHTTKIND